LVVGLAGTLELAIDSRGLDYVCDVPKSRDDVLELVERGDLRSSSLSFQAFDQEWQYDHSIPVRHLTSVRLLDVSPVSSPAYLNASCVLRSLAVQFDADPEDVFALARENDLRRMFTRSDETKTKSGRQALVELMAMAPAAYKTTMTGALAMAELTRMAMPQPTTAQRMVELTEMARPGYETADPFEL
jgi:Caudovirus prohead serine protease